MNKVIDKIIYSIIFTAVMWAGTMALALLVAFAGWWPWLLPFIMVLSVFAWFIGVASILLA